MSEADKLKIIGPGLVPETHPGKLTPITREQLETAVEAARQAAIAAEQKPVTMKTAKCSCGAQWSLEDVDFGETIECPGCGNTFTAPPAPTTTNEIAQLLARERNEVRALLATMQGALHAGGALAYLDHPEGAKTMTISATLAGQWAETLRRAWRFL